MDKQVINIENLKPGMVVVGPATLVHVGAGAWEITGPSTVSRGGLVTHPAKRITDGAVSGITHQRGTPLEVRMPRNEYGEICP